MNTVVSHRQRILDVFSGNTPAYLPFASRLDFWFRHHTRKGTLPEEFQGMDIYELSRKVGVGREDYFNIFASRFRSVEVRAYFEQELVYSSDQHETVSFLFDWEIMPKTKPGTTLIEYITPVGKLSVVLGILQEAIDSGAFLPIIRKHAVQTEEDFKVFEYIIERAEWLGLFDAYHKTENKVGEEGYLIPMIGRIPFQSALINVVGEENLFYMLKDSPEIVQRMIDLFDRSVLEKINLVKSLDVPYVELSDNLDGWMTNPRLFRRYALPFYQKYTDALHTQGKKVGSHTDGDLKSLVNLLPESGLDFCESFTPAPLTQLSFEEAWDAWHGQPKMWGGIPSMLLEERTPALEFQEYVHKLVEYGKEMPYILGICDAVMSDNLINRVRYIADIVNQTPLK